MALQQGLGQPQFLIQQAAFPGGQQYTTFPQFAYTNQQGQIVLQPAPQFSIQGGNPGQQGQQVILTNLQQKSGQPQMIVSKFIISFLIFIVITQTNLCILPTIATLLHNITLD